MNVMGCSIRGSSPRSLYFNEHRATRKVAYSAAERTSRYYELLVIFIIIIGAPIAVILVIVAFGVDDRYLERLCRDNFQLGTALIAGHSFACFYVVLVDIEQVVALGAGGSHRFLLSLGWEECTPVQRTLCFHSRRGTGATGLFAHQQAFGTRHRSDEAGIG